MSPQLYTLSKQLADFFAKHRSVFFLSFTGLLLASAIYLLYGVVETTFAPPSSSGSSIAGFNAKTIDAIKNLHDTTTTNSGVDFPCPRLGPFSEQQVSCIDWFAIRLTNYQTINNGSSPTHDTLCAFVQDYLDGSNCVTTSRDASATTGPFNTGSTGKAYVIHYRAVPQASNEIGYWDFSTCSSQATNGVASSTDPHKFALVGYEAGKPLLCVDNE